ncbi:MAG: bacteriohemerythrin [Desulfovibrionaceae bacterium]
MTPVAWKDEYRIGVEEIDRQHRKFFAILAELGASLEAASAYSLLGDKAMRKVMALLLRFRQYALLHFYTEERLMLQWRYEGFLKHKAEHNRFLRAVLDMEEQALAGEISVLHKLKKFAGKWYLDHILRMDASLAPYAQQDMDNLFELASQLHVEGELDEAVAIYSRIIKTDSRQTRALYNRVVAHQAMGDMDKARTDYKAAAALGDEDAQAGLDGLW